MSASTAVLVALYKQELPIQVIRSIYRQVFATRDEVRQWAYQHSLKLGNLNSEVRNFVTGQGGEKAKTLFIHRTAPWQRTALAELCEALSLNYTEADESSVQGAQSGSVTLTKLPDWAVDRDRLEAYKTKWAPKRVAEKESKKTAKQ